MVITWRSARMVLIRLVHAIKPRAVVPQDLFSRAAWHLHGHEVIYGVGPVGVRVRIVGRDHHVIFADSPDHVAHQVFFNVHRDEALAHEVIAWFHAEGLVGVTLPELPSFIQTIKDPR